MARYHQRCHQWKKFGLVQVKPVKHHMMPFKDEEHGGGGGGEESRAFLFVVPPSSSYGYYYNNNKRTKLKLLTLLFLSFLSCSFILALHLFGSTFAFSLFCKPLSVVLSLFFSVLFVLDIYYLYWFCRFIWCSK
ncbi:hypothetical protein Dsin_011879 [Dipteronia sinensis]|uniref:Uncharacterized protein n=1 Tax=Dipteronia sinensis TaxID=43782 RepID=A0AAE0AIC0_9ROSI|nr:hypothetical protein Dsin_011879 [Dipteronia sinensis]